MGSKPPVLTAKQVIAILENLNLAEVRQRGAQKQFRQPDGRATTVPVARGTRHPRPYYLRQIAKEDIGLTVEEMPFHRKQ